MVLSPCSHLSFSIYLSDYGMVFSIKWLASSDLGQEKVDVNFHSRLLLAQIFVKIAVGSSDLHEGVAFRVAIGPRNGG